MLYGISLFCLSQSAVIIRWSGTDPLILGAWRLLFAGLILYVAAPILNSKTHSKSKPKVTLTTRDTKNTILAGFAFFIHLFSYAYSAHHTSISHLMLIFSINPLTTALGSWFFFNEKLTTRKIVAYALALVGIYILAREKQGSSELMGDIMAIVAAITFSAYALLSQRARRDLSNTVFASRLYLTGSFFFFLTTFFYGMNPLPNTTLSWQGILLLTLFPTLIGHGIFTFSLKHIPLYVLSLGKLIEPAMAAITAFLLFGEKLQPSSVLSFVIIIASVVLVIFKPKAIKQKH